MTIDSLIPFPKIKILTILLLIYWRKNITEDYNLPLWCCKDIWSNRKWSTEKKENEKREKKQIRQINYVIKTVNFKLIYKWMKGIIINNYYLIRNKYEINKDNQ